MHYVPIDSLTPSHSTGPQAKDQGRTGGIPMCWNILGRHRYKHVTMLYICLISQHSSEVTTKHRHMYQVRTAHDLYSSTDQINMAPILAPERSIWRQHWRHIRGSVRQRMSQYGATVGAISWSGLKLKGHASHIQNM